VGAYGESIRHSPGLGDIYHLLRNKSGREGGREKRRKMRAFDKIK